MTQATPAKRSTAKAPTASVGTVPKRRLNTEYKPHTTAHPRRRDSPDIGTRQFHTAAGSNTIAVPAKPAQRRSNATSGFLAGQRHGKQHDAQRPEIIDQIGGAGGALFKARKYSA